MFKFFSWILAVHEVIKKACDEEKKRRLNVDMPICEEYLSQRAGVKRKLDEDVFSPSQIDSDILPDKKFNFYHRDSSTSRLLKSTSSPALDSLEKNKLDSNLKRPNVFGKSFVQEFHESVLQTTRQKELKRMSGIEKKLKLLDRSDVCDPMKIKHFCFVLKMCSSINLANLKSHIILLTYIFLQLFHIPCFAILSNITIFSFSSVLKTFVLIDTLLSSIMVDL